MRICLAIALVLGTTTVYAQRYVEQFAAQIQLGAVATFHSASFTSTGDVIDCGEFGSGTGIGFVVNGIIEIPIGSSLGIGIGLGYADRSVTFTRTNTYPIRDTANRTDQIMTTDMSLASSLSYLEIQPDFRFAVIGDFKKRSLGFAIGPRIALPLTTRFNQSEEIVSPENAVFNELGQATQTRTIKDAPYANRAPAMYGVSVGAETFIELSEKTSIIPLLSFDAFFNDVVTDADWKTWGVRAEVGVRFSLGKTQKPPEEPQQPPPPPPPPAVIAFAPVVIAVTSKQFQGEVLTGNQLYATPPIVNAVFFDSASATIPTSYRRSNDGSIPSTDPVEAHAWVLPRIADVVARNPNASIVLEGATSGAETEPEGIALAHKRAESVRDVLVTLGVSKSKIDIKTNINPRSMSNAEFAGGREENRRVDVVVKNAPLQEWVSAQRFAELNGVLSLSATKMGGDPAMRTGSKMTFSNADTTFTVDGTASTVKIPIRKNISADQDSVPINFNVSSDGSISRADTVVNVANLPHKQIDLRTNEFEAILRFDYNSSELSDDVRSLLKQLVDILPEGSTINIVGSSDVLGSEERNRVLSEQRAANTKDYIQSLVGSKVKIETSNVQSGTGHGHAATDNTPQGRFINRSIRITVTRQ